ncbi:MAG: type II toxin-antitoxin system death-on-curing family toxin [Terriglobales bacterium]|jgi:death-on-curing protein
MTEYLTLAEVLAIHQDQIERYGGSHGLRDAGLLESALFRPQTGYYADLIEEAAALWESLSQNHPFIDGNKRTAFAAMYTFLLINEVVLLPDARTAWEFIGALYAQGRFWLPELTAWLRQQVRAKP